MKKRLTCILLITLAIVLTAALGLTALAASLGDVSGDGKITAFDAQLIAEYTAGLRTLTDDQVAAIGELTVQDLLQYILGEVSNQTVYISANGDDSSMGTAKAPLATLTAALNYVADGGTIYILDTVAVNSAFRFPDLNKSVTISGGTLDLTAFPASSGMVLKDPLCFEDVDLLLNEGQNIYASGNTLYIDENTTTSAPVRLYGGSNGTIVHGTNMTVLGGNYMSIYGGSYQTEITGDVNLTVGGNVNPGLDTSNHSLTQHVYGGSVRSNITGKVTVNITGDARACIVYAGSVGSDAIPEVTIGGGSTLNMDGGTAMGLFGGSNKATQIGNATVNFSGGTVEQIFGGCNRAPMTGDVAVNLSGGTITRRVYGGNYNDFDSSFKTAHYVTGNVTLTIANGVCITFSHRDSDRSIYARSRHKTRSATEVSTIVFADQTAYSAYKNKLGAQDLAMKIIMYGLSAADTTVTP